MSTVTQSKSALMAQLRAGVDALYEDEVLTAEVDVREVSQRMLRSIPRPHVHNDLLGPFYDTRAVRTVLGKNGALLSRQAVGARQKSATILVMKTAEGDLAYPTFQFVDGEVDQRLVPVFRTFKGVDGWAVAFWLKAASPALGGKNALDWLRDGGDVEAVLRAARETVDRWSSP